MWGKKKLKLKAVSIKPHLKEVFPIVRAESMLPNWYKTMPLSYEISPCPIKRSIANLNGTIKGCVGVNNLLRSGFIIPAWEDISIFIYPDGTMSAATPDRRNYVKEHDKRQLPPNLAHLTVIKLESPWYLYGDDTKYIFVPLPYHNDLSRKYFMPHGIMDFKNQHGSNIFISAKAEDEPYEILIKAGQPLMQLIPLTNEDVELTLECDPNHIPMTGLHFFLVHQYHRLMHALKGK